MKFKFYKWLLSLILQISLIRVISVINVKLFKNINIAPLLLILSMIVLFANYSIAKGQIYSDIYAIDKDAAERLGFKYSYWEWRIIFMISDTFLAQKAIHIILVNIIIIITFFISIYIV